VFLGAVAVTTEDGIREADHAQTWLKDLMARRRAFCYVFADSSKLERDPFMLGPVGVALDVGDVIQRRSGARAEVPGHRGQVEVAPVAGGGACRNRA
jgi:hypothetical protein